MRVLQVLPTVSARYGGPVRSTLLNYRALHDVAPKIQTTFATTDQGLNPQWQEEIERQMPDRMELVTFPSVGRDAFIFSAPLLEWMWKRAGFYDLVVVSTLLNPISSISAWIARFRGVPYVVEPHGMLSEYTFAHRRTLLKRSYFQIVERRTLSGSSAVRFTSKAEQNGALPWGGETLSAVIPHPFENSIQDRRVHNSDEHRVLFLSRFHPKKGLDVLLPAIRRLRDQVPEISVVLAGSGPPDYEEQIHQEIRTLGLEGYVTLPGFVSGREKTAQLLNASVFVLPSRHENFGIAVAEAMDAGLPVVISRGVDIWQEIEGAQAGLVVDRTPVAVSDALERLLRDHKLRQHMGNNGRRLVRTQYGPKRIGRDLAGLYRVAAGRDDIWSQRDGDGG